MHASDRIDDYLVALAARQSTSGGGVVAALSAAQACALVSMVCHFTKNPDMGDELERAEAARAVCLELAVEDVRRFDTVMSTWKERGDPWQNALRQAARVPLRLLDTIAPVGADLQRLEQDGNHNLVTDTGIAAQQFIAAIDASRLNVLVNLKSIEDDEFHVAAMEQLRRTDSLRDDLTGIASRISASLTA